MSSRGESQETHTRTQTDKMWERPLALILLETACSSISYHIPAEQYATLGSKCSYLMLKGLYAQHAYSQDTDGESWKAGRKIFAEMCMFDKVKRGVFELYSLSAT